MEQKHLSPAAVCCLILLCQYAGLLRPMFGQPADATALVVAGGGRLLLPLLLIPCCILLQRYGGDVYDWLQLLGKWPGKVAGAVYTGIFLLELARILVDLYAFAEIYDLPFAVYLLPLGCGAALLCGKNGTVPVVRAALPVAAFCGVGLLLALVLAAPYVEPLRIAPFTVDTLSPLLLQAGGQIDWLLFPILMGSIAKERQKRGASDTGDVTNKVGNGKRIRRCIWIVAIVSAIGASVIWLFTYGTLGSMSAQLYYPFRMVLRGVGLDAIGLVVSGFLRLLLFAAVIRQAAAHLPPKYEAPAWYTMLAVAFLVAFWLAGQEAEAAAVRNLLDFGGITLILLTGIPLLLCFCRRKSVNRWRESEEAA